MWAAQIYLFEQNYIDATITQAQNRLEPLMEDLKTEDLARNETLVPELSKSASGKMMLIDGDGELIALYSNGYQVSETEGTVWYVVKDSEEYAQVLEGHQYNKVIGYDGTMFAIEIGIPVFYNGRPSSVILYYSLDEMNTMLAINRRQLSVLSLILTLTSAVLAALLSRFFVKPIRIIKETVDCMAGGDLSATPGLKQKDELGQLSHSVEELSVALQRVDILRKEVIANVSHELRAPLSLISGYAEMVRDINWKNAVILLAGGAFQFRGDYTDTLPTAVQLREYGYRCFVVDYRLRPYSQEEGALDVARAVRFISKNADVYGIDPTDIAVMGYSAGGIQAGEFFISADGNVNGSYLDPDYTPDELDEIPANASACGMIYSFYGRLSVASLEVEHLKAAELPPTFYCYGTEDPFYRQFEAQVELMDEVGITSNTIVLDEWPHGFGGNGGWVADYAAWLEKVFA